MDRERFSENEPECPHCGSKNVSTIGEGDEAIVICLDCEKHIG